MKQIEKLPKTSTKFKSIVGDKRFVAKFTKKDGDVRILAGTCNKEVIEEYGATPKGTGTEAPDTHVRVFDLENESWRTIILGSLTELMVEV